jgi:hypothetical protein
MAGHGIAHDAESEKRNFAHFIVLRCRMFREILPQRPVANRCPEGSRKERQVEATHSGGLGFMRKERSMKIVFLSILAAAAAVTPALAATCSAKSGAQTAALVELYTSEGCDSCPPADRWLSGLKDKDAKSGRAVPLAMHVDYWDYIGWHDPYAQAQFSARQREQSAVNHERTIYTPQILVAGKDFRPGWFSVGGESFDEDVARINLRDAGADIGLSLTGSSKELRLEANAKLRDAANSRDAALYLAVIENNLSSNVVAGENKGRLLKHDFVVRDWEGPFAFNADGSLMLNRTVNLQPSWKPQDLGVTAFVQNRSTGRVLQALQLAACSN